jgi:P-type Ca2+ transporter type 2C
MSGQTHRASYSTSSPYNSNPSSSPYARRPSQYPPRATPPSSAFFSERPDDEHEMQPVADAERHFGSSSSFRRHSGSSRPMASNDSGYFESIRSAVIEQGPSGIWDRVVNVVTGVKQGESPEQNGYELAPKAAEQSPSAKYSSYDAEVRPLFVRYPCSLPDEKCMI